MLIKMKSLFVKSLTKCPERGWGGGGGTGLAPLPFPFCTPMLTVPLGLRMMTMGESPSYDSCSTSTVSWNKIRHIFDYESKVLRLLQPLIEARF